MNLQYRIDILSRLGDYMLSDATQWQEAKEKASGKIAGSFLNSLTWLSPISLPVF